MTSLARSAKQSPQAFIVVLLLLFSQCATALAANPAANSTDHRPGSTSDSTDTQSVTQVENKENTADPDKAVTGIDEARSAVVQIEAVGKFVDPQEGQMIAGGYGSGFIIDSTGIAVTNNHVVTGGALFKVSIPGEEEPRNARVLGVSECSDLAVIDIQGDGFPYLAWHEGAMKVGLDVYAAGFPLGDPEYTLTKGIISKEKANGETNWASVKQVLQHDANIDHGSSGGPLLDKDGHVIGINYAGEASSNQFFAISRDTAVPVIKELMAGHDVDSIGVNGQAIVYDEKTSGIFVSSVASGSSADTTGLQPGDLILELEGIPMGVNGVMTEYCDVLRSHGPEDTMTIQVYRAASKEVLEGQINGRQLETSFSVADQVESESGQSASSGSSSTAGKYEEYVTINDSTGLLSLEVPKEWDDVQEMVWQPDQHEVGTRLVASTDAKKFLENWGIPGVIFNYSEDLAGEVGTEELLGIYDYSKECKKEGKIEDLPDGLFQGQYKAWEECGKKGDNSAYLVALTPTEAKDYLVLLEVYVASEADLDALDHVMDSFVINHGDAQGTTEGATTGESNGGSDLSAISEEDVKAVVDTDGLKYEYTLAKDVDIAALLPADWSDSLSEDWANSDGSETYGVKFTVSTNVEEYKTTWTTPGIVIRTSLGQETPLDLDEWLDGVDLSKDCKKGKRSEYSHEIFGQSYEGKYDTYTKCGGKNNTYILFAANSTDGDTGGTFVDVDFLALNKSDLEAFDLFLQSFFVHSVSTQAESQNESSAPALIDVTDDSGLLTVSVPESWSDSTSEPWTSDKDELGLSFYASPDIAAFNDGWETPGLFLGVAPEFSKKIDTKMLDTMLEAMGFKDNCEYDDRYEYDDEQLSGQIDVWLNCGGTEGSVLSVLAATPKEDTTKLVVVYLFAPTPDDALDFSEVLASLDVSGVEKTSASGNGGFNAGSASDSSASDDTQSTDTLEGIFTVTVLAKELNIREGPGTSYKRLLAVKKETELMAAGQSGDCAWLYVITEDGDMGWVSGGKQFVTMDGDCADLPEMEAP